MSAPFTSLITDSGLPLLMDQVSDPVASTFPSVCPLDSKDVQASLANKEETYGMQKCSKEEQEQDGSPAPSTTSSNKPDNDEDNPFLEPPAAPIAVSDEWNYEEEDSAIVLAPFPWPVSNCELDDEIDDDDEEDMTSPTLDKFFKEGVAYATAHPVVYPLTLEHAPRVRPSTPAPVLVPRPFGIDSPIRRTPVFTPPSRASSAIPTACA